MEFDLGQEFSPGNDQNASLPDHDVFGTSENETFYASKPYSQLAPNQKEIRLISILPKDCTGLIKCTLLPSVPLKQVRGRYTALSYCAGDPKNTEHIVVNGIRCNVYSNLKHALAEVRHFWNKTYSAGDKKLLLWTDQICINQMDLQERSHQVGFMRDIYEHAEQVLVCLSTTEGSAEGMEWLLRLAKDFASFKDDVQRHIRNLESSQKVGWFDEDESVDPWLLLTTYLNYNVTNERFIKGWLACYDVITSPWWSRAWIVQEFLVAPELHFLYCRRAGSWADV